MQNTVDLSYRLVQTLCKGTFAVLIATFLPWHVGESGVAGCHPGQHRVAVCTTLSMKGKQMTLQNVELK